MINLDYNTNFVVTSFYTDDRYKCEAEKLVESLNKFKISYDIRKADSLGGWHENTRYKATFLLEMLDIYDRLVWIDADGVVVKYPSLFDTLDCDVASTILVRHNNPHKKYGMLSGTIFLKNTDKTREMIHKWIEHNHRDANHLEQVWLEKSIEETEGINFKELPPSYTKIFDIMGFIEDSVIMHYQKSRQYRFKHC